MAKNYTTGTPPPTDDLEVQSNPAVQYIAGSVDYPYLEQDRALPQTVDDAERFFGVDIYDRMREEPILAAIEKALKVLTLNDGFTINPSIEEPAPIQESVPALATDADDKTKAQFAIDNSSKAKYQRDIVDYQQAVETANFVRFVLKKRLNKTDRPLLESMWELMDGMRRGHKLAEVTFDTIDRGQYKGWTGIESIRCKPRENYAFILSSLNTFKGVMARIPGVSLVVREGLIGEAAWYDNVVDSDKLLILNFDTEDNDPRGRSWWRAVYDPWYRKQRLKPKYLRTADRFANGGKSAVAPENANTIKVVGPVSGKQVYILEAIQETLQFAAENGGGGVYPAGTELHDDTPASNITFFEGAFSYADLEMATCLLLSAQAILEAKHSSKASSSVGQDLLDEIKTYCRTRLCEKFNRLIWTLVKLNKGEEFADRFAPTMEMQIASLPDFAQNATAVAALDACGYLEEDQKPWIDSKILGIKERLASTTQQDQEDGDTNMEDPAAAFAAGGFRSSKLVAKDQKQFYDGGKNKTADRRRIRSAFKGDEESAARNQQPPREGRAHY